jgi:hypothetical protein
MDVARDFVATANAFADAFVQHIAPDSSECDVKELERRRRETCAALWASVIATFEASALTHQEKIRLVPLVRQEMLGAWNKHCAGDPAFLFEITERSTHYLRHHDQSSPLTTAMKIMKDLLEAIDPQAADSLPGRRLAAMIAHRMLVDLSRLNDIKAGHQVE